MGLPCRNLLCSFSLETTSNKKKEKKNKKKGTEKVAAVKKKSTANTVKTPKIIKNKICNGIIVETTKEGDIWWEVDTVLKKRRKSKTIEYLVAWIGSSDQTWEPQENLSDSALKEALELTKKKKQCCPIKSDQVTASANLNDLVEEDKDSEELVEMGQEQSIKLGGGGGGGGGIESKLEFATGSRPTLVWKSPIGHVKSSRPSTV